MKRDFISVIIPCYNTGAYIIDAVESIKKSSYKFIKVIIVDDGSKDEKTIKAINEVVSNNPKNFIHCIRQVNKGVASARNVGARSARTKYIAFLDGDDLLSKDYLEKCLSALYKDNNLGFVYTDLILFGSKSGVWQLPNFNLFQLIFYNFLPAPALMKRSVWLNAGGYDEQLDNYEDMDFWYRVMENGYLGSKVEGPIYYYRQHPVEKKARHTLDRSIKSYYKLINLIRSHHPKLFNKEFINITKKKWVRTRKEKVAFFISKYYSFLFPFVPRLIVDYIMAKKFQHYVNNKNLTSQMPQIVKESLGLK